MRSSSFATARAPRASPASSVRPEVHATVPRGPSQQTAPPAMHGGAVGQRRLATRRYGANRGSSRPATYQDCRFHRFVLMMGRCRLLDVPYQQRPRRLQ